MILSGFAAAAALLLMVLLFASNKSTSPANNTANNKIKAPKKRLVVDVEDSKTKEPDNQKIAQTGLEKNPEIPSPDPKIDQANPNPKSTPDPSPTQPDPKSTEAGKTVKSNPKSKPDHRLQHRRRSV